MERTQHQQQHSPLPQERRVSKRRRKQRRHISSNNVNDNVVNGTTDDNNINNNNHDDDLEILVSWFQKQLRMNRNKVDDEDNSNINQNQVLLFSGSGVSVSSGLDTFHQLLDDSDDDEGGGREGLYEKAMKKKYPSIQNGKDLFRYKFYKAYPDQCFDFLYNEIYLPSSSKMIEMKNHKQNSSKTTTVTYEVLSKLMARRDNQDRNEEGKHDVLSPTSMASIIKRHYTFNVDGLAATNAEAAATTLSISELSSSSWHPKKNPDGNVVELHGTVHELVCRHCKTIVPTSSILGRRQQEQSLKKTKEKKLDSECPTTPSFFYSSSSPSSSRNTTRLPVCPHCSTTCNDKKKDQSNDNHNFKNSRNGIPSSLRFRVLLYDDEEGDLIHDFNHEDLSNLLDEDILSSRIIIWIGISFEQSSSCLHFQNVLSRLLKLYDGEKSSSCELSKTGSTTDSIVHHEKRTDLGAKRGLPAVYVINPDIENVWFHLQTSIDGLQDYPYIYTIKSTSDDFFQKLV